MSLGPANSGLINPCFPRVSGDEPLDADPAQVKNEFSPRERG